MNPPTTHPTVLIAAHDPAQTAALAQMVGAVRPGSMTLPMTGAVTVQDLRQGGPDGHAITVAMVVEVAGPEFGQLALAVRERHSSVDLILIAPRFDERAIELAAKVSARAIVTSPCEPGALARIFADLDRKLRPPGRCAAVETGELLRLHRAAASDGILHLAQIDQLDGGGSGAIHLDGGELIHAHTHDLRGVEAVREMLRWTDARATWIAGRSASVRTIPAQTRDLLERDLDSVAARVEVEDAPRDVLEKLDRLAQTPDILAAFLLRNCEIVSGRNDSGLDEVVIGRALSRLSQVFHDMEEQQGDGAGTEIQATVGEHRLVVDRLGPARLGFQVGVVVRQATPVCKSLRRLLRQIDRSFRKSLSVGGRSPGAARLAEGGNLHRVA
jgi:hypothetical protein